MNHIVQKGITRLFDGLLVTKNTSHTQVFCLPLYWLYIVFYDYAVFIFVWLFFFSFYLFVISNWHWQWLPVSGGGEGGLFCLTFVTSMSVFRHMPPPLIFLGMRTEHKYKLLQFFILFLFVSFCSLSWLHRKGPWKHTDQHEPEILFTHS